MRLNSYIILAVLTAWVANSTASLAEDKPAAKAPPLAVAPFTAEAAKAHQDAWAKHLGQVREVTNSIGTKFG